MKHRCIVWGIGGDYEKIVNQLQFEKSKGNIEIVALIARPQDIVESTLDGIRIIEKEEIKNIEFNYLIIASALYYKEIYREAYNIGIDEQKIINGQVMNIPLFDFNRYIQLIENRITILSDDCWGGHIYHYLHMKFYSPLININWSDEEFIKFAQDPQHYLSLPLRMEREGNIRGNIYPIGSLGEGDKKVKLNLIHSAKFSDVEKLWNRRRERINYNNLFIKLSFDVTDMKSETYMHVFDKIPYKKICFYSGENAGGGVCYLRRFEKYVYSGPRISLNYSTYPLNMQWLTKSIDVLKLLNGEEDYIREL